MFILQKPFEKQTGDDYSARTFFQREEMIQVCRWRAVLGKSGLSC